ncbi:MAG: hypothetical protein C0501_17640 [Isosphaera sp.]|nr:hypothetical protein [Isosphaera sp.]
MNHRSSAGPRRPRPHPTGAHPVNDPVISRFAEACGATAPLDLRVDLADGKVLAEGSVPMPFALVGQDDACDVTLTDAEVDPRHAWLQAVGGRVFAVDLGGRAGLGWPGGAAGSGWLDPDTPLRIGPFHLRLRAPVSARPAPSAPDPLRPDPAGARARPAVTLEFRNGKRARDRWEVNRPLTLVGRAPDCKVRLAADDVAAYHCGLVLTPAGLWVVDLSGHGVVVNGERMRVSPVGPAAELWVGRFLIGAQYHHRATPRTPTPGPPPPPPPPAPHHPADDEVPLGVSPPPDPASGLPGSHILADDFWRWARGSEGPVSHPVLVAESGALTPPPAAADPPPGPGSEAAALVRRLAELDAGAVEAARQAVAVLGRLFAGLGPDRAPAARAELDRLLELGAELTALLGEVADRAGGTPNPADWAAGRMAAIRRERRARWQALAALFAPPPDPPAP